MTSSSCCAADQVGPHQVWSGLVYRDGGPTTVNVQDAKTHLSRLLERAAAGERIVIARAGRPIAELGPITRRPIVFGLRAGTFELDDDAFFALDDEIRRTSDPDLFA